MNADDVPFLELVLGEIRAADAYDDLDERDKRKVDKALAGTSSTRPASHLARAAWNLAKRIHALKAATPPPPPPPPPSYVKVAPRVAYKTDRGDARYCMFNPNGTLRPGVARLPSGEYTDESGARYAADGDGLENSAIRSPGSPADCPTGSDSIDGRPYCSLPMIGDPTKNTGSWTV